MNLLHFRKESVIPCSAEALFAWHEAPGAFDALLPPGEPVTVVHHDGHVRSGARVILKVGRRPLQLRWELEHRDYVKNRQFSDVQVRGPFQSYRHDHEIYPLNASSCRLVDHIAYALPLGKLGSWLGRLILQPKFKKLFDYRHRVTLAAFT